ncbi:putative P-type ATPase, subfamily IV, P-type ATPase, transmembrane domain superfamily [Plasmopara halstedii]
MLLIFTTMFGLCLASAFAAVLWSQKNANRVWYLPFLKEADKVDDGIVNFFTFLILYNNLVPISLYVSLDIIKVLQANRITSDAAMVCDNVHAVARTNFDAQCHGISKVFDWRNFVRFWYHGNWSSCSRFSKYNYYH